MRNLATFALLFEALVGSVAFGALFMSPLEFVVKVLIGALAILFAGILELRVFHLSFMQEASSKLHEVGFRALERRLSDSEAPSLEQQLSEHAGQERLLAIARGGGSAYAFMLLVKFAIWLGGGAIMASYVLPQLLQRHL